MVQLYKLSSEQLSKQDHYDFGMRAVKSVLVMAGALRRKDSGTSEDVVLIRAMRDSNVPKFLSHDLPLFKGIINDLFPGVVPPKTDYGDLEEEIHNEIRARKFQIVEDFVLKVIQLLETLTVRHGIMVVGLTGTGKSSCISILSKALGRLKERGSKDPWHQKVTINQLNPKAVTMGQLFGMTNVLTNEWTEGLVSKLVKDLIAKETEDKQWIVFDGPVDTLWIESMNTVLDDSKMLCLSNGQRIKITSNMSFVFEVQDLKVASPATVSRCGMVYLEPVHLGWEPIIDTWMLKKEEQYAQDNFPDMNKKYLPLLVRNLKKFLHESLPFIREECHEVIESVDINLVQSCISLIDCLLHPEKIDLKKMRNAEHIIMMNFVFAFIWSVGANLDDKTRSKFNQHFKFKLAAIYSDIDFPDSGEIYDYFICPDVKLQKFALWSEKVVDFNYNPQISYFKIIVPTTDTVKYNFLSDLLLENKRSVLLAGETGVGKSVIVHDYLNQENENRVSTFVNFSAKTTSKNLQDLFETKLEKKRKTLLGPPSGKTMIFFIDDVNMPQLDRFGSQPPCELLRQAIDNGGFYDLKKLYFKNIKDTCFISCCAPPGGGRNEVSPRLFRQFNMIWIPLLSQRSMEHIFKCILSGFLESGAKRSGAGLDIFATAIVRASVEIYLKITEELLPTPTKSHYTFNLRDLSKVIQGVLQINLEDLKEKNMLVNLWLHETFRVFRDRLVNDKDRGWFNENISKMLKNHLDLEKPMEEFVDIMFSHFHLDEEAYAQIYDFDRFQSKLSDFLELYNSRNSTNRMNLVFFKDAIGHLCRISRILHQQRGNALIVGVGGSGRRSMARLAADIGKFDCFQIEVSKNYREKDFHEDLRVLLKKCGIEGIPVMFLFSDTQIVQESFLEDINNVLNTGEVPNLMAFDDNEEIIGELKSAAKTEFRDQILQFFVGRVRENLHIVLAFSPVGEQFRNRCRQFPSIINCCTIDWYNPWPSEALYSVAEKFYSGQEKLQIKDYKETLCEMSVEIHESVTKISEQFFQELRRKTYTTPTSYLELLKLYLDMLRIQRDILPQKIRRYKSGLKRLRATNQMVDSLKAKLIKLRPKIEAKEVETEKLVIDLEEQQKIAAEKEKICEAEAAESQSLFEEVSELKEQCEKELNEAMPIYKKALAALDTLKVKDIIEMKSYPKPPDEIVMTINAVCLLMGKKENWAEGKLLMNEPKKFIERLKDYKKESVPPAIENKLYNKYIKHPDFVPEKIVNKSKAAESICLWVGALYSFGRVYKVIAPKKARLEKSNKELNKAKEALAEKQKGLQLVRDNIAILMQKHGENVRNLEDLRSRKELIELQLERAEKLVKGLADEAQRWKVTVGVLEGDLFNIVGNILLAAGAISYIGPFNAKYR